MSLFDVPILVNLVYFGMDMKGGDGFSKPPTLKIVINRGDLCVCLCVCFFEKTEGQSD